MRETRFRIRCATGDDRATVAGLASELAASFPFRRERFETVYDTVLGMDSARLLLAVDGDCYLGYLLGFRQPAFYANGSVAEVAEIFIRNEHRRRGAGRALMSAFEQWAAESGCALVALATRRAVPFYRALGYEESATYLRKLLG